jgi:hypothetical protein
VTIVAALILAICAPSGAHAVGATFFWCLAGLGAAFGLDRAVDASSRSRRWKA